MTRFLDNLIARVDDRRRPDQFSPRRRLIDVSVETATIDKGIEKNYLRLSRMQKKFGAKKKKIGGLQSCFLSKHLKQLSPLSLRKKLAGADSMKRPQV